jgi:hypothetical protein
MKTTLRSICNVGCHDQHTTSCHANLKHTYRNAIRFARFFDDMKDTRLEYAPKDDLNLLEDDLWESRGWGYLDDDREKTTSFDFFRE